VKFIDSDGKDIRLYNVTHRKETNGKLVYEKGNLSAKTEAAMKDYIKTDEGKAYLAQFAKAGQIVGGYKFTEDGILSNHILNIMDLSFTKEKYNITSIPGSGTHSIEIGDDGKATVTIKVVSYGTDKATIGETLTHEMQLHGYNEVDRIKGKIGATTIQDHKALRDNDSTHKGYIKYKSVQQQLEKIADEYKRAFQKAQQDAKEIYKNL
jgi:hypothetical protein